VLCQVSADPQGTEEKKQTMEGRWRKSLDKGSEDGRAKREEGSEEQTDLISTCHFYYSFEKTQVTAIL
jgi:hypothetical protein